MGVLKGGGYVKLGEGVWLLVRVETAFGKGNSPCKALHVLPNDHLSKAQD